MLAHVRRRARRAAGRLAGGLRRPERRTRRPGRRRSPSVDRHLAARIAREFARNAEVTRRALDDLHGRGHQPLVPLRPDLPHVPGAADALRLRGGQRRRLGALRRPGEDPPARGLADARVRARLDAPAAPAVGHAVLLPGTPTSGATSAAARRISPRRSGAGCSTGSTSSTCNALARGWAGCRRSRPSTATRSTSSTRPSARASTRPSTWSPSCEAGRLRFAVEDPDAPENFPRVLTVWRANLLGSSGKGQEYFLQHLLGADRDAVRAEESPPELRPREVRLARARCPRASSTC